MSEILSYDVKVVQEHLSWPVTALNYKSLLIFPEKFRCATHRLIAVSESEAFDLGHFSFSMNIKTYTITKIQCMQHANKLCINSISTLINIYIRF